MSEVCEQRLGLGPYIHALEVCPTAKICYFSFAALYLEFRAHRYSICQPCYFLAPQNTMGQGVDEKVVRQFERQCGVVYTFTRWAHFDFENSTRAVNRIWPSSFWTPADQLISLETPNFFIFLLVCWGRI